MHKLEITTRAHSELHEITDEVQELVAKAKINSGLSRFAGYVLDEYSGTLSDVILSTVERWDAGVVTGQLDVRSRTARALDPTAPEPLEEVLT